MRRVEIAVAARLGRLVQSDQPAPQPRIFGRQGGQAEIHSR